MNRHQRAKARALARVHTVAPDGAARFARQLAWLAEHEPATVLTAPQRWYLDALVWRYRRQLAGEPGVEIPREEPQRAHYLAAAAARAEKRGRDLNGGHPPPQQDALL